jgi:hypothetical protein
MMDFMYTKHDIKESETYPILEAQNISMTGGHTLRSISRFREKGVNEEDREGPP